MYSDPCLLLLHMYSLLGSLQGGGMWENLGSPITPPLTPEALRIQAEDVCSLKFPSLLCTPDAGLIFRPSQLWNWHILDDIAEYSVIIWSKIIYILFSCKDDSRGFPGGSVVKNPPANTGVWQETGAWSLGQEDSSGVGNGNSSSFAWKIPWSEEPGRLQSKGSQKVRRDWAHMPSQRWEQQ